jgi:hypothetical protein
VESYPGPLDLKADALLVCLLRYENLRFFAGLISYILLKDYHSGSKVTITVPSNVTKLSKI